ncbi:RmlC-like cupin domain-containing protein [Exophiala viscosa]|nr:RmlC-like cupin domain-containing protein [Exophiala viscosa]
MGSTPAFTHLSNAQKTYKPPLIANENAFLGDVATSEKLDPEKPISAGFYRLEKGTPLVYTYTYHEMKIIVEGEFDISDETGQKVHATPGDVFYFPKGSVITFTTDSYGLGFYCGQRPEGAA